MEEKIPGVPQQNKGGYHDTKSEKCFDSVEEAQSSFQVLKKRFLDVNSWHSYSGEVSASFYLYNSNGEVAAGTPAVGDFFKIEIPGPGNEAGDGFDWVTVAEIDEKSHDVDERCMIKCVPSSNPCWPVVLTTSMNSA